MGQIRCAAAAVACALALSCFAALAEEQASVQPTQIIEHEPRTADDRPPVITAVAVPSGGGLVATAGDDHVVRLWSTSTGKVVHVLETHGDWVRSLAFSPDGQMLASAGDDKQIVFWDVNSGKEKLRMPIHQRAVYSVAFSPDGLQLAAAGFENVVRLYDTSSGQLVRQLEGPCVDLRSVVYSPNGTQLAAAGRNGQIRVWTMPSAIVALNINGGRSRIRTLAYLPQGESLVSAGESRTISIWDAHSGELRGELKPQSGKVLAMAVCGENFIATGGSDNLVRVWNWRTQQEANRLQGHTGSVATLAFDSASSTVISGSFDTTVRVWKLGSDISAATNIESTSPEQRVR
jgi:WD40 repeat protein